MCERDGSELEWKWQEKAIRDLASIVSKENEKVSGPIFKNDIFIPFSLRFILCSRDRVSFSGCMYSVHCKIMSVGSSQILSP